MLILSESPCSKKIHEVPWTMLLLGQINFPNDSRMILLAVCLGFVFCCASFSLFSCLHEEVEISLEKTSQQFSCGFWGVCFFFFFDFLERRLRCPGGSESLTCWASRRFLSAYVL